MTKRKGPQMADPQAAEDALANEVDALIEAAAEDADEQELAERERKANAVVEKVRARVSRRERA